MNREHQATALTGGPAVRRDFLALAQRLRRGIRVGDAVFDEVFPVDVRRRSGMYWTPISIALRAARLLGDPGARILDVGSGVGKFCIVAAASHDLRVTGIEHRRRLVDVAEAAAADFGVRAEFKAERFEDQDPSAFDGVYLFNPFGENTAASHDRLDDSVELSDARFLRDIAATEAFLDAAKPGMRVVTYCGFGGTMPASYVRRRRDCCAGVLELWVKAPSNALRCA